MPSETADLVVKFDGEGLTRHVLNFDRAVEPLILALTATEGSAKVIIDGNEYPERVDENLPLIIKVSTELSLRSAEGGATTVFIKFLGMSNRY